MLIYLTKLSCSDRRNSFAFFCLPFFCRFTRSRNWRCPQRQIAWVHSSWLLLAETFLCLLSFQLIIIVFFLFSFSTLPTSPCSTHRFCSRTTPIGVAGAYLLQSTLCTFSKCKCALKTINCLSNLSRFTFYSHLSLLRSKLEKDTICVCCLLLCGRVGSSFFAQAILLNLVWNLRHLTLWHAHSTPGHVNSLSFRSSHVYAAECVTGWYPAEPTVNWFLFCCCWMPLWFTRTPNHSTAHSDTFWLMNWTLVDLDLETKPRLPSWISFFTIIFRENCFSDGDMNTFLKLIHSIRIIRQSKASVTVCFPSRPLFVWISFLYWQMSSLHVVLNSIIY